MRGEPVREAKRKLKAKYSYGKILEDPYGPDGDLATVTFVQVLKQFQVRYNIQYGTDLRTDGVLDWATQVALGLIERAKPVLFTVHGTGQRDPVGPGYPADIARQLLDLWEWQPIGNYPADAFPMGPSVQKGRRELIKQIKLRKGKFALIGYSQGAIVISLVWKYDILAEGGELHDRLGDVIAAVTLGNPMRELGVANGNLYEGVPIPDGQGISDDLLVDTPDWWFDFAHGANSGFGRDIYTDTPDSNAGEMMTAIYKVVQNLDGLWVGTDSLLEQIGEILRRPVVEIPAMFYAIILGGQFITTQPFATAPHCNYNLDPAVRFLRSVAEGIR
ncbi:peptidoglycan-binding domain-containing protein [Mycolicibacterium palauense]|uniref:peptidoglycan-binding domain-containing protein n=1 Tax=Mycolicibacterium palauense TaxID=2034511 RepID=UPI00159BA6D7|nr:peptidoglycan-binding domain-containing protein [Mycolicibacterium palauense]